MNRKAAFVLTGNLLIKKRIRMYIVYVDQAYLLILSKFIKFKICFLLLSGEYKEYTKPDKY